MKILRIMLVIVFLVISFTFAFAKHQHIYDYAGVLTEAGITALEERCVRLEKKDANLIGIIVESLNGEDVTDYAKRMEKELNIGKKGILFVLVTEENKVGYYYGGYYNGWFDELTQKTPEITHENAADLTEYYVDYYCDGLGMSDYEYTFEDYKNIFLSIGALSLLAVFFGVIVYFIKKKPYFVKKRTNDRPYKFKLRGRANLYREQISDEYEKQDPYDYI